MTKRNEFGRVKARERLFGAFLVGVPLALGASTTIFCAVGTVDTDTTIIVAPFMFAWATVAIAANLAGFTSQFAMERGAFVVVANPDLGEPCAPGDREYIVFRQPLDKRPHPGKWLFCGGFPPNGTSGRQYTAEKFEDVTGVRVRIPARPVREHPRRVPHDGVSYWCEIFEGFLTTFDAVEPDNSSVRVMTARDLLDSADVPGLVSEFVAQFEDEYATRNV